MHTTVIQGVEVPALGFGTWLLEGGRCEGAVADALDVGYRHIDTAQAYGNEDAVGAAIAASGVERSDIFLTTKLTERNVVPDKVRPSTEDSLRRLRSDYVDLLLIHWPSPRVEPERTVEKMVELREDGLVRHVGVSNFPPSWVERAANVAPIFCNQVEYHPYLSQQRLRAMAVERDFLLTAYSPLARGKVLDDATLTDIASDYDAGVAQVVLAWLLQQDHVATIPKASSREHIESNFAAQNIKLSDDDMQRLFDLDTGMRLIEPSHALDWER